MNLEISYGVVFGKCDSSDRIAYDSVTLTDAEADAVMLDALLGNYDDILENPMLQETYNDLYAEIEDMEIANNLDLEDEFTMECQGENEMDPEELNDLVHAEDYHALEFFDLLQASDDEIDLWDANDLDDIPTVKEFYPDFEPESPYDNGLELNLFVDDVEIEEEEVVDFIKKLLAEDRIEDIKAIQEECTLDFSKDITEIVRDAAMEYLGL